MEISIFQLSKSRQQLARFHGFSNEDHGIQRLYSHEASWEGLNLLEKVWTFMRRFEPSWEGSSNRRNLLRRFMWIDPKLIFQYTESKWIVSSISHLIETYLYHFTNFARWCVYPVYYLSQIQIVWLSGFLDMLHFKKTDTDMLNLTTCQWSPGCHSRRFFGRSHCLACIF